jgi:hypothetical protein
MWKIDPKDNHIHKCKHDYLSFFSSIYHLSNLSIYLSINNVLSVMGLFEGTRRRRRERKRK